MNAKEAYSQYQSSLKIEKERIKLTKKTKSERFWAWVALLMKWPFKWLWMACHDWRLILIFVAWAAILGCEVWVPLLIAWLVPPLRASMLAVAGTCEAFWLSPFTPFMPLCIALTMGTKAIMDKIGHGKSK